MNQVEYSKKIQRIIAKCGADERFKHQLLADPVATLKAEGVAVLDGVSITVVENTDKLLHLVIPVQSTDLSDDDLGQVVGGDSIDSGQEAG